MSKNKENQTEQQPNKIGETDDSLMETNKVLVSRMRKKSRAFRHSRRNTNGKVPERAECKPSEAKKLVTIFIKWLVL